jgi:phospholipid/cholesterol/gamma-HCH transport system substrate-binding protein
MDTRVQRYRLGMFVIGAFVLLAVLTVFFGGTPHVFTSREHYTLLFENAPGVSVGTPVRRSGIRIGEVTAVDLDNVTGEVRVEIGVNRKYTLWTSDKAVVNQDLLSRDTTIDFVPHTSNTSAGAPRASEPSTPVQPQKLTPPVPIGPPVPVNPPQKDKGVTQARWREQDHLVFVSGQQPKEPGKVEIVNPPVLPAVPGAPPGEVIPPGATIRGHSPTAPSTILSQAGDVIPSVQQSLFQIRRLIEILTPRLDEGTREIALLARSLRETVPEVRRTNDELRLLIQGFRNFGPGLRRTNDELQMAIINFGRVAERIDVLIQANQAVLEGTLRSFNELTQRANMFLSEENQRNATTVLRNLEKSSGRFESIANNADQAFASLNRAAGPFGDRSDRVLRNLDISLEQIARLANTLNELVAPIGRGEGSVQKLFSDPSFYNNLNDAAFMLTKLLPRVNLILIDLQTFADKIARHPETIGVGGAVRPSSGLKEGPSGYSQPNGRH